MKESKANPQLNYRIEKAIQDEFKRICDEQAADPGKLIKKFMLEYIEKNKKPQE